MTRKLSTLFFLLVFSGFSIQAFAYNPKLKKPGIGEGIGTGGVENTNTNEVKLPIGLPFSINDAPGASGPTDGNDGYEKIVYTFDLPDGQGPQSYHETHSAFEQARSMNAACVLIRMNSMSNALDAAENLSNEITDYDRPVMVYVNDKAIPASTLISMAADNKKNAANPKHKQAIAAKSKLTSDNQVKRAPRDERDCTTMSNVLPIGKQFTTGQNGDLDEVLTQAGLNNYTVVHYSHGFFAQMIDWCMKPVVSLLLIVLIALGLRLQIRSVFPGPATFLLMVTLPLFGVPLFVGGLAGAGEFGLTLFFVIATIIVTRRKSASPLLRFAAIFFFILALTLCQSMSFGPLSDWKVPVITFLLSSATFLAGWYLPVVVGKFRRSATAELSPAL